MTGDARPALQDLEELLPSAGRTVVTAQRRYLLSPSPWPASAVGRSLFLSAVGVFGIGACWFGASRETNLHDQVGWILGSLMAVAAFELAGVTWLTQGFREVRRGVRDLEVDKKTVFDLSAFKVAANSVPAHQVTDLVTAEGMTRAHRPDCPLVLGKNVRTPPVEVSRDLERCGVCLP